MNGKVIVGLIGGYFLLKYLGVFGQATTGNPVATGGQPNTTGAGGTTTTTPGQNSTAGSTTTGGNPVSTPGPTIIALSRGAIRPRLVEMNGSELATYDGWNYLLRMVTQGRLQGPDPDQMGYTNANGMRGQAIGVDTYLDSITPVYGLSGLGIIHPPERKRISPIASEVATYRRVM